MDENRKKALAAALGQLERQFGKGAVMRLGDSTAARDIEVVSTGSLALDVALGIGGLPKGRVIEIYGPESSGKTTLTLQAIAECQKQGGTAAFVDAEHALDPVYAEKIGVKRFLPGLGAEKTTGLSGFGDLGLANCALVRQLFAPSRAHARVSSASAGTRGFTAWLLTTTCGAASLRASSVSRPCES